MFFSIGPYHVARIEGARQALASSGWEVLTLEVCQEDSERPWGRRANSLDITTLYSRFDEFAAASGRDIAKRVTDTLDRARPAVVFVPGWGHATARRMLSWAKKNSACAVVMSESKYDDKPRRWLAELAKKWLYVRKFDAGLVGGERHKSYLEYLGMPPHRIFKGYDVVDNTYFQEACEVVRQQPETVRQQYGLPACQYFLTANRFIARKNLARLIEAYRQYRDRVGTPWDLVLLGSGEQEAVLKSLVSENGLARHVRFPGFVGYDDMPGYLGLASAFIHPALSEQWGLVVNESLAAGVPVLVSETVGSAELVRHGQNGYCFDATDTDAMAATLVAFHQLTEAEWEQRSRAAMESMQAYGPREFGAGVSQIVRLLETEGEIGVPSSSGD